MSHDASSSAPPPSLSSDRPPSNQPDTSAAQSVPTAATATTAPASTTPPAPQNPPASSSHAAIQPQRRNEAPGRSQQPTLAPAPSHQPPEQRLTSLLRSLSNLPDTIEQEQQQHRDASTTQTQAAASADPVSERLRLQRRDVQLRHATMLDSLIRNVDIVAYAQMSILYYMDNSLFRLLLRLIPHWLFFTPKPAAFPPPPRKRPYVLHVVFANLTCALLHLLLAAPSASEATRGYLHGGFLIDFVGERGPVSKMRLLLADAAVLLVQLVMLAAVREREKMRDAMGGGAAGSSGAAEAGAATGENLDSGGQDYDAEEQGIRRDTWGNLGVDVEMEMEELVLDDEVEEGRTRRKEQSQHPLDRFYTGQFVVAELCVWEAVLGSWKESAA